MIAIVAGVYLYNNWKELIKFRPQSEKDDSARVVISGVVPGGHFFGSNPGMVRVSNLSRESVNVTGWRIEGNRGVFAIPKAVEVYNPSGFNSETDIVLLPGDTLSVFTNPSANGANFLINKCMGYLDNTNFFDPPLPRLCPRPNRADLIQLSGICQSYLMSLGACQSPEPSAPLDNGFVCLQKLQELNYRGCFNNHGDDKDFLTGDWRVWGSGAILDPLHDIVKILDKEGLIVDDYIY